MRSLLVALALLSSPVIAAAPTSDEPWVFTAFDDTLKAPRIDEVTGDATFGGHVDLRGTLRVERDETEFCRGACAYFVPDAPSRNRLPQVVTSLGVVLPVVHVNLYEARPVLVKGVGKDGADAILSGMDDVYEVSAVVRVRQFKVYGACSATHYEAKVHSLQLDPRTARSGSNPHGAGC